MPTPRPPPTPTTLKHNHQDGYRPLVRSVAVADLSRLADKLALARVEKHFHTPPPAVGNHRRQPTNRHGLKENSRSIRQGPFLGFKPKTPTAKPTTAKEHSPAQINLNYIFESQSKKQQMQTTKSNTARDQTMRQRERRRLIIGIIFIVGTLLLIL